MKTLTEFPEIINSQIVEFVVIDYSPLQAVDNASIADSTRSNYKRALRNYLDTGSSLVDAVSLKDYANSLKNGEKSFLRAAIQLWTQERIREAKSMSNPNLSGLELIENEARIDSAIRRYELLTEAINVKRQNGSKVHDWLSVDEIQEVMSLPDTSTLSGRRDRILLGLLFGSGLRRQELSDLTFADISSVPSENGRRTVINVRKGKGGRSRSIPISNDMALALVQWHREIGDGFITRGLKRNGELRDSLSSVGVFRIVNSYGQRIGRPKLAPHDCRRSYAQAGFINGVTIVQLSKLLGHSSISTTEKYLCRDLDVDTSACDFIPFSGV